MFFRNSRELRDRIEELDTINSNLELSNAGQRKLIDQSHATIQNLEESNSRLSLRISSLDSEIDNLKKLVREQTEADLLLNALKAVGIIKTDKPIDWFKEQNRLLNIQNQLMGISAFERNRQQNVSGLGTLGGLFGGVMR